jgi:large subunit ribosomal protein L16
MVRIKKSSHRPPIPHFVYAAGTIWDYPCSDKFLPHNFYNFQTIARYSRRVSAYFSRKQMFFHKNMLSHVRFVAAGRAYLSDKTLETLRRFLRRFFGKHVILRVLVFPKISRTQKPVGVRIGKGKGKKIVSNVAVLTKGQTIFEVVNVSFPLALKAVRKLSYKLSFPTALVRLG